MAELQHCLRRHDINHGENAGMKSNCRVDLMIPHVHGNTFHKKCSG